ncbi:metallophosphoesterase [Azomonas macrocytogenes]|uniref:Serine/threonine protein phosphatase 1 n=1 Tax=Azomonas macrocytogenes TaxID=69962 RepID=A0A839T2K7_AZOMA|nr:metallophosphoesterase [Azomonas macrocytogenes]MBB3103771.1 serine/threonine protein phosphatase 1 [Azomonas macrocytogenes]
MSKIRRFERNTAGKDYAVGDIHGHFTLLQQTLDAVAFDPACDRLFSVGDLVDRGPENEDVDVWLNKPWFHAVRGNHEQMAIDSYRADFTGDERDIHLTNGGTWFYGLSTVEQRCYAELLSDLPFLIEVETASGLVGLVHADCPRQSWADLVSALETDNTETAQVEAMCLWSRRRVKEGDESGVAGIRAVVVGHSPLRRPTTLGNVYHIDTGGWLPEESGYFTLLDLDTLQAIPPIPGKLTWDWDE